MSGRGNSVTILGISLLSILILTGTSFAFDDVFAQTSDERIGLPHEYYGSSPIETDIETALFAGTTTSCSVPTFPIGTDLDFVGVFATPIQVFPTEGTDYVVLSTGIANLAAGGIIGGTPQPGIATTFVSFATGAPDGIPYPFPGQGATVANDVGTLTIRCTIPSNAESLSIDWVFGTDENPTFTDFPPGVPDFFKASVQTSSGSTVLENFALLPNGDPATTVTADPFSNQVTGFSGTPSAPFPSPDDSVYNAVTCTPGTTPSCSQPITSTISLTSYQGQTMDFIFQIGDASDAILDTAVLIDNFNIQVADITPPQVVSAAITDLHEITIEYNEPAIAVANDYGNVVIDGIPRSIDSRNGLAGGNECSTVHTTGCLVHLISFVDNINPPATSTSTGTITINPPLVTSVEDAAGNVVPTTVVPLQSTIIATNSPPVATDDNVGTDEDTPSGGNVITQPPVADSDPDGDPLTVIEVNGVSANVGVQITLASGALLTVQSDGTANYDPNGQFEGLGTGQTAPDSFTYTISDGNGGTDSATVNITIDGVNDAPVATDNDYATDEDNTAPASGNVITDDTGNGADSDVEGDILAVTAVNGLDTNLAPASVAGTNGGTFTIDSHGAFTFDPGNDFQSLAVGEQTTTSVDYTVSDFIPGIIPASTIINPIFDSFMAYAVHDTAIPAGGSATATLTITVTGLNDVPTANNDGTLTDAFVTVDQNDTLVGIDVEANDVDIDTSDVLSATLVDQDTTDENDPKTLTTRDGSTVIATFTRDGVATVGSSIDYDPNGQFDYLQSGQFDIDVLNYTVSDGNDGTDTALLFVNVTGSNDVPIPLPDTAMIFENGGTITVDVIANDTDTDFLTDIPGLHVSVVEIDSFHSGVTVLSGSGSSVLSFTEIGILTINDNATPETADDDTVTFDPNGQFEFLAVDQSTTNVFNYTSTDQNGGKTNSTLTVTVKGENDAPVAVDDDPRNDAYDVPRDSTLVVGLDSPDLLDNDYDVDSDAVLTTSFGVGNTFGTGIDSVTVNPDGTFSVVPTTGFAGETSFTYNTTDNHATYDTATATVSFYSVDLSFSSVDVESDVYVNIVDAFATGNTVDFTLRSENLQGTTVGSGTVLQATRILDTDTFQAHIVPSLLANPTLPVGAIKFDVQVDNTHPTDTIIVSYRDILDDDSTTINPASGFGFEATNTEPIKWNSDIYQLGDAATLTIFDESFASGGINDGGIDSIQALIKTSTDPVGFMATLQEEATNNGLFTFTQHVNVLFGGPSSSSLAQLSADETDFIEASTGLRLYTYELDNNFDGVADITSATFGGSGDVPIVGKWSANAITPGDRIGIYRDNGGLWVTDDTGNAAFDAGDGIFILGSGSVSVVNDWNGDGFDTIGVFTPETGVWEFDEDGDGLKDVTTVPFGGIVAGVSDHAIVGDWNGVGGTEIGIFRNAGGLWALDTDDSGTFTVPPDYLALNFGQAGDIPVVGNWNVAHVGDEVGVYRPSTGEWILDEDMDGTPETTIPPFGGVGDIPIVGDWNGDGQSDIGIYRPSNGLWAVDSNGNRVNEAGGLDKIFFSGQPGDIPIVGDWDNDGKDSVGIVKVAAATGLVATADIISPSNDQQTQGAGFNPQVKLTCDDDADLDGICDEWVKATGIEFTVDGAVHTQGARPLIVDSDPAGYTSADFTDPTLFTTPVLPKNDRKQMFYELDYMTGHKPAPAAIEQLVQTFANAPVNNLDGSTGIDLFITVDEDYGFHEILVPFSGTDDSPGFDQFKVKNFGTKAERERADAAGFTTGKFQYTRYIAMLHQLTDSPQASGYSEIGGNDAAITLGAFAGGVGSTEQQAGTLVHEVGHNIFLNHGGDATDDVNCKPNYLSAMNYLFQFEDLVSGRPLDFSHQRLADLNENNLNENTGITLSTHPTAGVLSTLVGPEDSISGSTALSVTTGQPVNYNRDADSTDTGVVANINFFDSISDCQSPDLTVLTGHNDWAGIKIPFRDEATFADGLHTKVSVLNELDTEILTGIVQDIQSEQIAAISQSLNSIQESQIVGGDLSIIVPLLSELSTIDGLINPAPPTAPDFATALDALVLLRADIDALPFDLANPDAVAKKAEVLGLVDTAINVLEVVVMPSAETDHDTPIANSQLDIIDNLDPFETTLTGSDPNGGPLTFSLVTGPSFGTLGPITSTGPDSAVVTYTPGSSFVKTDSFQFKVNEGTLDSLPATVSIILNQAPIADSQSVILEEGVTSLLITLTGQDSDSSDVLTFLPSSPSFGTISEVTPIDARSASIVYTPSDDFDGFDNISFTVNDGLESSATTDVKVIVAGKSVTIFDEHPPKDKIEEDGEIEPAKPAVQIHKDKPIHIIIDGTTIDVTTIDPTTVFFGPIGNERSGAQGIHVLDPDFDATHIKDLESDDALTGGLALDGVNDIEFHFRMSDLGIDPQLNDENGEQTLCLAGFADPPADAVLPIPIQIFGCIDLTVGGEINVGPGELLNFNPGSLWDGEIKVDGGTAVLDQACIIKDDVKAKNGGIVTINNCTIDGKIKMNSHDDDDATPPTGGSLTIRGGSTVAGDVKVEHTSLVSITDNPTSFGKNIHIEHSQDVTITNNNIVHDLKIKQSGTVLVDGNIIGHNFKSDKDQIVTVTGNTIGHDLKIKNAVVSCTESGNILLDPEGKNSGCPFIEPPPVDADGDGFLDDVDCDDSNPLINPAATEILDNVIDEDCDGEAQVTPPVDEDEATLSPQILQAVDEIGLIIDTIEEDGGLIDTEAIKDKDADKITKELSKAVHELTENNDINKACEKLDKFNDKVSELVSDGKLDAANANLLTAAANGVKTTLGCL